MYPPYWTSSKEGTYQNAGFSVRKKAVGKFSDRFFMYFKNCI